MLNEGKSTMIDVSLGHSEGTWRGGQREPNGESIQTDKKSKSIPERENSMHKQKYDSVVRWGNFI